MANLQQIQFTLEDLLVVKLIIKERPCLQKKKKGLLFCLGEGRKH